MRDDAGWIFADGMDTPASRASATSSVRTLRRVVAGFARKGHPPKAWHALSVRECKRIRRVLLDRKRAPATVNLQLCHLNGVLRTCWELGLLDADEYARRRQPRVRQRSPRRGRYVPADEIAAMLGEIRRDRQPLRRHRSVAIFELLTSTGLRANEVAGLRIEHTTDDRVHVLGKGQAWRVVPFPESTSKALAVWHEHRGRSSGPLFRQVRGNYLGPNAIAPGVVSGIVRRASEAAQLRPPATAHDLRRSYATSLLNLGVDVVVVQRLLGHRNLATTALYDFRDESVLRAAAERHADFLQGD